MKQKRSVRIALRRSRIMPLMGSAAGGESRKPDVTLWLAKISLTPGMKRKLLALRNKIQKHVDN